jgi:uncharacterized protein with HEPN domain
MQSEDRDISFLWDILEAAKDIRDFVRETTLKEFTSDKKTRYAVERQLLVIGEAAKRVSESYKRKHNDIPWKRMVGLRNILAHEYGEVLVERIWLIAAENIPPLIEILTPLVPNNI